MCMDCLAVLPYRMKRKVSTKVSPDQIDLPGLGSSAKVSDKVAYVKAQPQTRNHGCHWPGCTKQVPPAMWGCRPHWYRIPAELRGRIWRAYSPGQEVTMRPSESYLEAADAVQAWIKQHGGPA
jgi:hypothetical protein